MFIQDESDGPFEKLNSAAYTHNIQHFIDCISELALPSSILPIGVVAEVSKRSVETLFDETGDSIFFGHYVSKI